MNRSTKLLTIVTAIALFSSVGLGAPLDEINGVIDGSDTYQVTVNDAPEPGADFFNSGLDIESLHWGVINDGGLWYTLGMTVTAPPINTTGDGTGFPPIPSTTDVQISLSQGGNDKYLLKAIMFGGAVFPIIMIDRATSMAITIDPADIKYRVDTGLEIAIRQSYFPNLSPASPFDFKLDFSGGGTNQDDSLQGRIPEPATMSILLVGGLAAVRRRRRR